MNSRRLGNALTKLTVISPHNYSVIKNNLWNEELNQTTGIPGITIKMVGTKTAATGDYKVNRAH